MLLDCEFNVMMCTQLHRVTPGGYSWPFFLPNDFFVLKSSTVSQETHSGTRASERLLSD